MKKEEALLLAEEKSKLVIELITQTLTSSDMIFGTMDFNCSKIKNQKMCTLDIYVPEKNLEKHLNLGITTDHADILYEQLVNDFLDLSLESETIGISKYASVKNIAGVGFCGMNVMNTLGSKIKINFLYQGQRFDEIMKAYNQRIDQYLEASNNSNQNRIK